MARGRPGDQEEGAGLVRGQPAQVGPRPADELPPAAATGLGVDGDPGQGEALEVAPGRALADLELLGQLGGGDPPLGLQHQEGGHEAIGTHMTSLPRKVATGWPLSGRTMASPQHEAGASPAETEMTAMPGLVASRRRRA